MSERNRAGALFALLFVLSVSVASTVMVYWYMNTRTMYLDRVGGVVELKKDFFRSIYSGFVRAGVKDPLGETLKVIEESFDLAADETYTCDFIVQSEQSGIRLFSRKDCSHVYTRITTDSPISKYHPVAMALRGKRGRIITKDVNGDKVIAAYDFIDIESARLAIIAKIDYDTLLLPKIKASVSAAAIAVIITIGGGLGFYNFSSRKLNELKKTGNDLRIMADIMNSVDEYIAFIDKDLRFAAANRQLLKFADMSLNEIKSKRLDEILINAAEAEEITESAKRCLNGETINLNMWLTFFSNSFFADIKMTPHYTANELTGLVMAITDRTEEEKARQSLIATTHQLTKITEELEERVQKESAKRLRNERLFFEQKKFADMGQMMNAIAHQWRQPINSMGLYVQLVYESIKDGTMDEELLENYKHDSLKMVQHMSKTIDDFRCFFDPRSAETKFEIIKAVLDTVSLVEAQLKHNSIGFNITCTCPSNRFNTCNNITKPPCTTPETMVNGYSSEFKQVLMNIIQNAKDALMEKAGEKNILVAVASEYSWVTVTISDNGGGIPNDVMDKIFDPYFTTKPEGKGTGIGLYMSKVIIEDHMHGKLIASNTDEGAIFRISLKKVLA